MMLYWTSYHEAPTTALSGDREYSIIPLNDAPDWLLSVRRSSGSRARRRRREVHDHRM